MTTAPTPEPRLAFLTRAVTKGSRHLLTTDQPAHGYVPTLTAVAERRSEEARKRGWT